MADCRSLVEFLRAFERRRRAAASSDCSRSRRAPSTSSSSRRRLFASLCDHSPMAALDALALLAVLAALAFLVAPYARLLALELGELVRHHPEEPYSYAPFAAGAGAAMAAVAGLLAWEAAGHRARRCGKPRCRGMRKAVEFDIQLETEECVRGQLLPAAALLTAAGAAGPVELGDAHRELEAELRKMAPPNGRTVLIFRSPCGCPKGRMEVWGAKKVRRIKKFSGPKFCFPRVSCACSRTACRYFPWASIRSCRCRCTCQFNFRYLEVAFQMIQGESWNAHEPHDCFWSSFWVMNMNVSSAGFCTSRR